VTLTGKVSYNSAMLCRHRITNCLLAASAAALAGLVATGEAAAQSRMIKKSGEWRVIAHDGTDGRICFAVATPKSSDPPAAANGAHFYVSAWPKDGVRAEISVKTSAPMKPGAPASIAIDQVFYKAFSRGDRAFVIDPTDELKLIEAMKKGSTATVLAQSEQGTVTRDIYSLSGISQALQAVSAGCR